jgi:RND family efflux transporter MFP subunit
MSLLALAASAAPPPVPGPPEVEVAQPATREVADYEDFTGRLEPSATVRIKARVTGYLDKVLFKDGAEVKKGDALFEIDPRPYQADLKKAEAEVAVAQAVLARAEVDLKRAKGLFDRKALAKDELDRASAAREEAWARHHLAKAVREVASLYLDFTRVSAPISGRIGRRLLDMGNLAKADDTDLATLVCLQPMYVSFAVDEATLLRLHRAKGQGLAVAIRLADEDDFRHRAEVQFAPASVDPKTGTTRLRAVLPNSDKLLLPGLFVRVRLTTSKPYKALLVPEQTVGSDAGQKFVLVVNQKDEVEIRKVRLGQRHGDLVVVKDGLVAADRVVLAGRQRLRPGMKVTPRKAAPWSR